MRNIRRFGLIGHPLGHSLSPWIHDRIMQVAGVKGEYKLYDLEPQLLSRELPRLLSTLHGFNCTIPHKQAIIPYLEDLAPSALAYGAVNTVFEDKGYNTDGAGFAACAVPMEGRRVCVLGAGGVARVLALEAARSSATEIIIQARNQNAAEHLVRDVKQSGYKNIWSAQEPAVCDVILNGTPAGMWPKIWDVPALDGQVREAKAVFDTIYNPTATRLVLKAKSSGIWAMGGLQMLFEQALASQKIWNPEVEWGRFRNELAEIPKGLPREVLRQSPLKIVLTGFMGSGKSHVGHALSIAEDLPFVDLDETIVARTGQTIAEIFESQGEAFFRSLERDLLLDELRKPGSLVLATGGGTLVQDGVLAAVRSVGALVVFLDVSLDEVLHRVGSDPARPMLKRGPAETLALYTLRRPLYEAAADLKVPANGKPAQVVKRIMTALGWDI